jgi:hypothetical protein
LPAPLGQAQSDVQGCRRVATASSSCAKAQDAYDNLNCIDGEGSPCSGACLQFQVSRKTVQALPCFLTCPVAVSSLLVMMAISRWSMSLQLWIVQKTPCFVFSYVPVEKHPIIVSTIDQVTANAHVILAFVMSGRMEHYAG